MTRHRLLATAHGLLWAGLLMVGTTSVSQSAETETDLAIALIGDSTVCDYPESSPRRGWGQMLPELLGPRTEIINLAKGGASTKSFPRERWASILVRQPDLVLIQFGHNDMKKGKPDRYTAPDGVYAQTLREWIAQASEAGIQPVLVTPVRRRTFTHGKPTTELAPYAQAMKTVAAQTQVPVVDLYSLSGEFYETKGEEATTDITVNKPRKPSSDNHQDRTHLTKAGARQMAELVLAEMKRQSLISP